jgi:hypothetical protein
VFPVMSFFHLTLVFHLTLEHDAIMLILCYRLFVIMVTEGCEFIVLCKLFESLCSRLTIHKSFS